MRLNEQRDTLVEAVEDAGCELIGLRASILRKMAAPYGDGSRSNMVNAETDVLPRLTAILDRLQRACDEVSGKAHVFGTDDVGRLKGKPKTYVEEVTLVKTSPATEGTSVRVW